MTCKSSYIRISKVEKECQKYDPNYVLYAHIHVYTLHIRIRYCEMHRSVYVSYDTFCYYCLPLVACFICVPGRKKKYYVVYVNGDVEHMYLNESYSKTSTELSLGIVCTRDE